MPIAEYKDQMLRCHRCSICKWVTLPQIKSSRFSAGCPSIREFNFHAYAGGGKVITALGLVEGLIDYTDEMLQTVWACQLCGSCDISCKTNMGEMVEPLDIIRELRMKCVEDGQLNAAHMVMVDSLKREDNPLGNLKADRGKWADGLDVKDINKEKVDVMMHAGCMYSYDEELWPIIRGAITILKDAGVDVGIAGSEESCCGGRAFDIGYRGEMEKYAEDMVGRVKASGAGILVTCCSDGYGTFKQLYPMVGQHFEGVEVLHITQYFDRLIKEGKIKLTEKVPMRVTYHDPCHLGRLGEPHTPWDGTSKLVLNKLVITEPKKDVRFGSNGVYDQPRNILAAIPGLDFVEMERIREYSFCCGAGGGVKEALPDFAISTAIERIEEAKSVGAEALVTACPWCKRNFKDALKETGDKIEICDVTELIIRSMEK